MENRRFDPEEQDDSTPEASTKKKRGGSRLSQYLSILKGKEDKESTETAGEKGDEKPKRFRRLFSRLFPSVVEKPEEGSAESKDYGFDPEAWFGVTRFATRVESSDDIQPEEAATAPTANEATPEQPVISGAAETTESPREQGEVPAASANEAIVDTEPVIPDIQQAQPSEREFFIRNQEQIETQQAAASPPEVAKETVIERGPGMVLPVALVGLEHLGRKKADKKLEKRVDEKIAVTNKEVNRNATLQQELETLTRHNSEQLEALKRAREARAVEYAQPVENAAERSPVAPAERIITKEQPKPSPDKLVQNPEVKEQVRSVVEQQVKEEIQPERILEQIADAAEHDLPVERIFERSHEVKDDNAVPVGTAASVGAVMNAQAATNHYQALNQMQQPVDMPQGAPVRFATEEATRAAYKQAAMRGFWAAVMIIILGSIAYLVIQ